MDTTNIQKQNLPGAPLPGKGSTPSLGEKLVTLQRRQRVLHSIKVGIVWVVLVSLLIGVNDQYRGYPLDDYREDFRFMLGKAIEYAGGDPKNVIVLSIPDWGVTPFAAGRDRAQIAKEIDDFNAVNRSEAQAAGVGYLDITPISRQAAGNPALVASDGLHPSGEMYRQWVDLLLPLVQKEL